LGYEKYQLSEYFNKVSGEFDYKYAVDYEIKFSGVLICGIQIKPKSYLGTAPYLKKAQSANRQKNIAYLTSFGKPVFDVISQTNGVIINPDILKMIKNEINKM